MRICVNSHRTLALAMTVVLSVGALRAGAQAAQPAPADRGTIDHVDPAYGYELQLPADWSYDRSRFQQFRNSIGLLKGRGPAGRRSLQITVFRSFDMKPFEDWVIDFGKAIAEIAHAKRVDWETWQLPPRAGAVLSYEAKSGADVIRTHCLCVPFDPNTVWVFAYTGVVTDDKSRAQLRAGFDACTRSLKVHYDPEELERLAPAFERGRALIERVREVGAQVRPDESEHIYEILVDGAAIGYMQRQVTREEYVFSKPGAARRFAKFGLRVRERSWRFAEAGAARFVRIDLFSSFDGQSEVIEHQRVALPSTDVEGAGLLVTTDQAVREDDVLVSSFTTNMDRALPDPSTPMSVGPVYLDQAWLWLLPGLVLGQSDEPYACAAYDFGTRALLPYIIRPQGARDLPDSATDAYLFEVQQGYVGAPSKIYIDARGTLLRMENGSVVIRQATPQAIERKFGARRNAAEQRRRSTPTRRN
jgi:hypothetical protein